MRRIALTVVRVIDGMGRVGSREKGDREQSEIALKIHVRDEEDQNSCHSSGESGK